MQTQAREAVYWPDIDADIANYFSQCTICTKHKASPPAQAMLPRDVPYGPWQEIAVDYLTHKGRDYLLSCDLFSKYPLLYKVSTKSAQSLCLHLLDAHLSVWTTVPNLYRQQPTICIWGACRIPSVPPHRPFHILPPLPQVQWFHGETSTNHKNCAKHSPGFAQALEDVLLDLWLTPIGPNMPSPQEILHNRTFKHPTKPSQPVEMESARNYLLSRKQSPKTYFDKAHGACDLPELGPGQEVLFWSPAKDEYIPRTIIESTTVLHSYVIEAQGKRCCRTKEHLQPIHLNLPIPAKSQPLPPKPKVPISHIPKPNPKSKHVPHSVPLPGPSSQSPCYIPHPPQPHRSAPANAAPSIEDLLWHLSALSPFPSASVIPEKLRAPSAPQSAPTPPVTLEEVVA